MFDKEEGYTNDEDLAKDLSLNFEDENTMVDEEISQEALFISQYENSTGDISLTLENTLLPYKYFIPSFIDEVFFKFYCCGCGRDWSGCKLCWDRVGKVFGISLVCNDNAFDRALKQVIMEYQTFDDKDPRTWLPPLQPPASEELRYLNSGQVRWQWESGRQWFRSWSRWQER